MTATVLPYPTAGIIAEYDGAYAICSAYAQTDGIIRPAYTQTDGKVNTVQNIGGNVNTEQIEFDKKNGIASDTARSAAAKETDGDTPKIPSSDSVAAAALSVECVIGARVFEWQGNVIVAVITTPFYLKSERDGAKLEIRDTVAGSVGYENVYVTFDTETYRNIHEDMSDREKQRLFELAVARG